MALNPQTLTGAEATESASRRGTIELGSLTKRYGQVTAVDSIDLEIASGEFFTLLGPSGSGKTTTLMMLAGFAEPTSGSIRLDGRDIGPIPPERRGVGVVFQNYALFPHLTVRENLAFPLEMQRLGKDEIRSRVGDVLDLIKLPNVAERYPSQLSGGQQQRIAVARAVVSNPPVLLMDEPLGALDRNLREHLQTELRSLQRTLGVTVVYVTHDQTEAMVLSDRLAIMNEGGIEQVATPTVAYNEPESLFVANFLGDNNTLHAYSTERSDLIRFEGGVELACHPHELPTGRSVVACVRPERIRIAGPEDGGALPGTVRERVFLGPRTTYTIAVPGVGTVDVNVPNDDVHAHQEVGDEVHVSWPSSALRVFEDRAEPAPSQPSAS